MSDDKVIPDTTKPDDPMQRLLLAAAELGWDIALETAQPDAEVEGIVVGTAAFIERTLKNV